MKKIHKICVVACLHGNEKFGLKVLATLEQLQDTRLCLHIGNLEAVAKNGRFVESDMNRSFSQSVKTKEAKLADGLRRHIKSVKPDLVLDLHTSTVKVGKVGIVATRSKFLDCVAARLGMENVVIMLPEITRHSLIGQFASSGLSIEFGKGLRSSRLALNLAEKIVDLLDRPLSQSCSAGIYNISRIVHKPEIAGLNYANFEFSEQLGGYPFLMGESNYSDIAGFLAERVS